MSSESQPMGSPFTVTPTITSAAPALWTNAGTSYLFMGLTGHLLEVNVSNQTLAADNSNPGSASITGRISIGTKTTNRVLAGDDGGTMWAISPTNFAGTNKVWSYAAGSAVGSSYYDYGTDTVMFGTTGGNVLALDATAGTALSGYPFDPDTTTVDPISAAPLYTAGILAVGTSTGKLFFIDRRTGTSPSCGGPSLLREYSFGPSESVSGIGYDGGSSRYMVTTSSPSAADGRLYYIDTIGDTTSCQ